MSQQKSRLPFFWQLQFLPTRCEVHSASPVPLAGFHLRFARLLSSFSPKQSSRRLLVENDWNVVVRMNDIHFDMNEINNGDALNLISQKGETKRITFPGCYNARLTMRVNRPLVNPYAQVFLQMLVLPLNRTHVKLRCCASMDTPTERPMDRNRKAQQRRFTRVRFRGGRGGHLRG